MSLACIVMLFYLGQQVGAPKWYYILPVLETLIMVLEVSSKLTGSN